MRVIEILDFIKKYDIQSISQEQMLGLFKGFELASHQGEKVDQHDIRICFSLILALTIQDFLQREKEFYSYANSVHDACIADFAEMFISELKREIPDDGDLSVFHFLWLGWDLSGRRPLISPELISCIDLKLDETSRRLLDPSSRAVAMTLHEHGPHGGPRLCLVVLNRLATLPQGSWFEAKFKKCRIYAEFQSVQQAIATAHDNNRRIEKIRDVTYWTIWGCVILMLISKFGFFGLVIAPLYWGLHSITYSFLDSFVFDKKLINLDQIKFKN